MAHRSLDRIFRSCPHAHLVSAISALLLVFLSACSGQLPRVVSATPATEPGPVVTPAGGTRVPAPSGPVDADLLSLPGAFRYEVTLRPVQDVAPATVITGKYRNGAWAQTSRTGDQAGEELVAARDAATGRLHSYTRAAGDAGWTRWPGVTFDAAYGLASPFTILRLRPLATRSVESTETAAPANAPDEHPRQTKSQVLFSTEIVQRVLTAGVQAAATNNDARAALEEQIAPFFVPQTVTYWSDPSGRVLQAAASLLSLGPDGRPAPWLELTATYFAYGDPSIVVNPPANATDIAEIAGSDAVAEQASAVQPGVTLRVRVFAAAGVPAADSVVTVYAAGKKTAAEEKPGPDAQFALKAGLYDVLVRSDGAQQWLKGVAVKKGALASNDVLLEFAPLTVSVTLNGATLPVDVVVYPAGDKTNFAGFVSENPARFHLPVGTYDVEVASQDGRERKRVNGVEVRSGLETTLSMDLARP